MKLRLTVLLPLWIFTSPLVFSTLAQTPLKVCPDPAAPCASKHKDFAPYEMPFKLPAKIKPNTPYKSEPFFAIILKDKIKVSAEEECDGGEFHKRIENERKQMQKLYPERKVFASYQCPDMAAITYEINGKGFNENFIAVYGGTTQEEANQVIEKVKAKYPKAIVKKMRAVFENIQQ